MDEVVDVMEIMMSMCDNKAECMCYEFDIDTSKKRKRFLQNPSLYLVQKMRSSDLTYKNLTPEDKKLVDEGMAKEVSGFLSKHATQACTALEQEKAQLEGRITRARWVLTWKPIP